MKSVFLRLCMIVVCVLAPFVGAHAEPFCERFLHSSLTAYQKRALGRLDLAHYAVELITAEIHGQSRNIVLLAPEHLADVETLDEMATFKAFIDAINTFELRALDAASYFSLVRPEMRASSREDHQLDLDFMKPAVFGNIDHPLARTRLDRAKTLYAGTGWAIAATYMGILTVDAIQPGLAGVESAQAASFSALVGVILGKGTYDLVKLISGFRFKNALWYRQIFIRPTDREGIRTENIEQAFAVYPDQENLIVVVDIESLPELRERLLASPNLSNSTLIPEPGLNP